MTVVSSSSGRRPPRPPHSLTSAIRVSRCMPPAWPHRHVADRQSGERCRPRCGPAGPHRPWAAPDSRTTVAPSTTGCAQMLRACLRRQSFNHCFGPAEGPRQSANESGIESAARFADRAAAGMSIRNVREAWCACAHQPGKRSRLPGLALTPTTGGGDESTQRVVRYRTPVPSREEHLPQAIVIVTINALPCRGAVRTTCGTCHRHEKGMEIPSCPKRIDQNPVVVQAF